MVDENPQTWKFTQYVQSDVVGARHRRVVERVMAGG
jgi:hypothetical protein